MEVSLSLQDWLSKLVTTGDRGACLFIWRVAWEWGTPSNLSPVIRCMAGSCPCLLKTPYSLKLRCVRTGLVLHSRRYSVHPRGSGPVSGTKDKTKYNGMHSCCSYHLAKRKHFKSTGHQPGTKTKYVFLIISQYHTRRNLNLFKNQSLKVRQISLHSNLFKCATLERGPHLPPRDSCDRGSLT